MRSPLWSNENRDRYDRSRLRYPSDLIDAECETITQPPAPFHVTPRGLAEPNLLAMILFERFSQHQPSIDRGALCPRRRGS